MIIVIGNTRSFGVFFLEILQMFNASSSTISTILGTENISTCITGFVAMNLLAKFISLRTFVLCGCALCSLTFVIDSFTTDILLLPFSHILNGAGLAFVYGSCIVVQSTYFDRYLGTANAISACGVSIGQFILPHLLNYLIKSYGVRGALLLNASIYLQCIVFAALLRPLSYYDAITPSKAISSTDIELDAGNTIAKSKKQTESSKLQSDHNREIRSFLSDSKDSDICGNHNLQSVEASESTWYSPLSPSVAEERIDLKGSDKSAYSIERSSIMVNDGIAGTGTKMPLERFLDELRRNWQKLLAVPDFTLFKQKIFVCGYIGVTLGSAVSSMPQTYFPTHSADRGLSSNDGVLILTISGLADFVGRLLIICLADRKFLNRARLLGVALIIHGVTACFISYYTNFFLFAMYCAVYGLSSGIHFSLSNTVMVDFIGAQRISDAVGLIILGSGIIRSVSFPFTGYLRDVTGSYNIGFLLNGVGLLISGAMFLAEPFISYTKHQ